MEPGILSQVCLFFQNAALVWAPVLGSVLHDFLIQLICIGWFFMLLSEIFVPSWGLFPAILTFLMGAGFSLAMVDIGAPYIDDLFRGVAQIGVYLGLPPLNPDAVLSYGSVVTHGIMRSLADQGMLSYLMSPTTWVFTMAGLMIHLAFAILTFQLVAALLLSSLLTASCPWFFAFAGMSWTRGVTYAYARLVLGTMTMLFMLLLLTAVISELSELLQQYLQTHFLAPGSAPGVAEYAVPLMVGVVLCGLFAWLPQFVARQIDGVVLNWSGGWSVINAGGTVVNTTMPSGSSGSSGGQQQTSSSNSSGGGSGWQGGGFSGSQSSTVRQQSAWGK